MWIVDWEYSGMNDPLWDVGDLSVEAGMTADQDAEMMLAYFDRTPTAAENGRASSSTVILPCMFTISRICISYFDMNPPSFDIT